MELTKAEILREKREAKQLAKEPVKSVKVGDIVIDATRYQLRLRIKSITMFFNTWEQVFKELHFQGVAKALKMEFELNDLNTAMNRSIKNAEKIATRLQEASEVASMFDAAALIADLELDNKRLRTRLRKLGVKNV
ncbi:MAG: hypothetical protein GY833_16470 [Aestuariibacter sp.]|nr:hypothetical protein [Aestuariibacter sp.]